MHGKNWNLVAKLVGNARTPEQIERHASFFYCKLKQDPTLPGHELKQLLRKKRNKDEWTDDQVDKLLKGIRLFGKNPGKISEHLKG